MRRNGSSYISEDGYDVLHYNFACAIGERALNEKVMYKEDRMGVLGHLFF